MTTEWILGLGKQTLFIILSISMPMLGVGMVLGILMSIIQTVTSIRDQSMMTVVKIAGVVCALLFSLPWILNTLIAFTTNLFLTIPTLATQ